LGVRGRGGRGTENCEEEERLALGDGLDGLDGVVEACGDGKVGDDEEGELFVDPLVELFDVEAKHAAA
jgi:hypothetical protein